ncbi:MAG: sulfite exporter TauE/SafE family protein [Bacteroidales bacterium]|nr:sulfite exporter TauE/SafE family protein [Bacteroidales bacterium]
MEGYTALLVTALTIGVVHTIAGPDHYLPFVALSKSRNWSMVKTINIVIISGLAHVLSSVVIGFIGIGAGIGLSKIELFEGLRGNIAAWLLFSFGVAYTAWAAFRLIRRKGHVHKHLDERNDKKQLTVWIIFLIFLFGPCEPLIPILMYPAADHNYAAVGVIALVFAVATIGTMLISVLILLKGIKLVKLSSLEKYQHVIAGSAIMLCGAGILFLGL